MIEITEEMREESPYLTEFCEFINTALLADPKMSLAAFAERINQEEREYAIKKRYKRLIEAERKQFGGIS